MILCLRLFVGTSIHARQLFDNIPSTNVHFSRGIVVVPKSKDTDKQRPVFRQAPVSSTESDLPFLDSI